MDRTFLSRLMVKLAHSNEREQNQFFVRYPYLSYDEIWRFLYPSIHTRLPLPDIIFYLYAPLDVLQRRVVQKESFRRQEKLRFNKMNEGIIRRLIDEAPEWLAQRIVRINTNRSLDEVFSDIIAYAKESIGPRFGKVC